MSLPLWACGNVTTAHDLSPISAALDGYDFIIGHRKGKMGFQCKTFLPN